MWSLLSGFASIIMFSEGLSSSKRFSIFVEESKKAIEKEKRRKNANTVRFLSLSIHLLTKISEEARTVNFDVKGGRRRMMILILFLVFATPCDCT